MPTEEETSTRTVNFLVYLTHTFPHTHTHTHTQYKLPLVLAACIAASSLIWRCDTCVTDTQTCRW